MWLWRKLASAKWEDAWAERLVHLPPERLVMVHPAGSKMLRIEAYLDKHREVLELQKLFGGSVSKSQRQMKPPDDPGRILRFGNRLVVVSRPELLESALKQFPGAAGLAIPAEMAFGTGEHATTGMCLRLLVNEAPKEKEWTFADIGCGTGVIALAARKLGAKSVLELDNDPHAIRIAKRNAALNRTRNIRWEQADILKWRSKEKFDGIAANLFSELLIASAKTLHRSLNAGGFLICSGLLATQQHEVTDALTAVGFKLEETKRRGRWVAMLWRR